MYGVTPVIAINTYTAFSGVNEVGRFTILPHCKRMRGTCISSVGKSQMILDMSYFKVKEPLGAGMYVRKKDNCKRPDTNSTLESTRTVFVPAYR